MLGLRYMLQLCTMKINEKVLASYASCSLPVDLEGWLLKRGEVGK